jgi:hypothetical protein
MISKEKKDKIQQLHDRLSMEKNFDLYVEQGKLLMQPVESLTQAQKDRIEEISAILNEET